MKVASSKQKVWNEHHRNEYGTTMRFELNLKKRLTVVEPRTYEKT